MTRSDKMFSIEEAIKHCEEVEKMNEVLAGAYEDGVEEYVDICRKDALLYRQIIGWLKELKDFRDGIDELQKGEKNGNTSNCYIKNQF